MVNLLCSFTVCQAVEIGNVQFSWTKSKATHNKKSNSGKQHAYKQDKNITGSRRLKRRTCAGFLEKWNKISCQKHTNLSSSKRSRMFWGTIQSDACKMFMR